MDNEVRMFSTTAQDAVWLKMLEGSSRSKVDAALRKEVYQKVFSNYESLRETAKAFSGMAEVPILSNQYFNATVASYVRSFAGFLTIERAMDQPTALLWYNDLLGVTNGRKVLPNLGKEDIKGINGRFNTSSVLDEATKDYSIATNKKIIPGTVEIKLIHAAHPESPVVIRDDRNGNLLAPAGVLGVNAKGALGVDYRTGVVTFTIADGFTIEENDKYSLMAYEDVAGDPAFGQLTGPGNNRFKVQMNNIVVTTEPDMLVAENNLMAIAAAQKAIAMNPAEIAGAKLTELYTKLVNDKFVAALDRMWSGNVTVIDLTHATNGWLDLNSYYEKFMRELDNIDTLMAEQAYKISGATAYVCGKHVGTLFTNLRHSGNFVKNTESTYVNDLLGYYNGIPVLRHLDVDPDECYAVAKTADGQLAPIMRGIFLPLTNTPIVGNYNNPTQYASGVYYQEANSEIVPELMIKFRVQQDF